MGVLCYAPKMLHLTAMAWEQRNGRSYYYAKRREGKKVVSVYLGRGTLAELAEETVLDGMMGRQQARKEKLEWQELEQLLDQVRHETTEMLKATGLHRPQRKPWRRKRSPSAPTS